VPDVRAIATFGHTPGHIALSIASEGEQLLHVSDAVLYPLHLEHPEWTPVFDMLTEQAFASKHRIFDLAAEEDALVFAHHFPPFPNLGLIRKQEQGWQWQPIERQG
jgi:glyoxylase-like metal-dependent hydrolase (beta-lactamase superfamily II)